MVANRSDEALMAYKGKHAGQRAFIIGNGPSLTPDDLTLLKGEHCFACNKIYLAFDQTEWRPTYYTVEDHLVALGNSEEIEAMNGTTKFFPHTLAMHGVEFSNSMTYEFIWKDVFPELPGFSDDAMTGLHWGSTVTYTMMQMACFMGFTELYLLGIDFSFTVPEKCDNPTGKFNVYICEGEVNHFHKDYRKPGEKWHQPNLDYQEKSFLKARQFTEESGRKVFNATRGGKLEIFPRVSLEEVLG